MNPESNKPNSEDSLLTTLRNTPPVANEELREIIKSTGIQAINEHEAASILRKSVQSLRNERFLKKGCPYIKLGRSVRYLAKDVEEYLLRNRIDPAAI